ncbi:MAG: hypothetical protein WC477_06065 [Patescibacteria group bacterium]
MRAYLYFRWFDMWIGVFYDRKTKATYIQLLPMIGIVLCKKVKVPENEELRKHNSGCNAGG